MHLSLVTSRSRHGSAPPSFHLWIVGALSVALCGPVHGQTQAPGRSTLLEEAVRLQRSGDATALRQSIVVAEQALALSRSATDRALEAGARHVLGRSRYLLSDLEGAIKDYEAGLAIRRELMDVPGEATTRAYMASAYWAHGSHDRALEEYSKAAALAESVGDAALTAYALNGTGNVYQSRGDPIASAAAYERARELWARANDSGGEGIALNNLGALHETLGETQTALRMYREALPRLRDAREPRRAAVALENMGALNVGLGRTEQARSFLRQALELARATGDRRGEARTRLSLGRAELGSGALNAASIQFARALTLARAVRDQDTEGDVLHATGDFLAASGRQQEALKAFSDARTLHAAVGSVRGEAHDIHATGGSLRALGRMPAAAAAYEEALALRVSAGDRNGEADTRFELARVRAGQGRLDEARALMEQCLALVESVRSGLSVQNVSLAYFATVQRYYRSYVDLLMGSYRQDPSRRGDLQALDVITRARARGLLDLMHEAGADVMADVPPPLVARHLEVRRRISFSERRLAELQTGAERSRLERQIGELVDQAEALEAEMKESSPAYAALSRPLPASIQRTQQLLDGETTLLVYGMGDARMYAWTITRESVVAVDLADRAVVQRAAAAAARAFEASRLGGTVTGSGGGAAGDATALAHLSDVILRPLAGELRTPRVVIVADGPLESVPIGALPAPREVPSLLESRRRQPWLAVAGGYRPLMADRETTYLSSASMLAALRSATARRLPSDGTIRVFADPVFASDDPRVALSAGHTRRRQAGRAAPESSDSDLRADSLWLARLPSTRREAEAIAAVAGASARLSLDFDASRAAALELSSTRARIVHFATHAVVDERFPELGGVHLSRVTRDGKAQDGLLHLEDVYGLRLSAELVVLSACRTASGREVGGEGLVSLVRGFMAAGAQRVVASLWSVDDAATAELMSAFYTALLRDGLPPAAALREAQRHVRAQPRWSAPFYWAAFVLQGDWQ